MEKKVINIGDFSEAPFGRVADDGRFNGERFRKEVLVPALKESEVVEVNLDEGLMEGYEYGSSFLHEAFGGLVLKEGFASDELESRLTPVSAHMDVVMEVKAYIRAPEAYV